MVFGDRLKKGFCKTVALRERPESVAFVPEWPMRRAILAVVAFVLAFAVVWALGHVFSVHFGTTVAHSYSV